MTRTVWPSMSAGKGLDSSCGSVGICPVMKHQPSTSTAWLNGATGVGAPGAMKKSGTLIGFLSLQAACSKRHATLGIPSTFSTAHSHAPAVDDEVLRRDQP